VEPIERPDFDRAVRHLGFKGIREDMDDGSMRLQLTRFCPMPGCPFVIFEMDAEIYDPQVLGLNFENLREQCCEHEVPYLRVAGADTGVAHATHAET
jgi:hypothetical protein